MLNYIYLQQVGPSDSWKFRHIVFIVMGVGTIASLLFHLSVKETQNARSRQVLIDAEESGAHNLFIRKPLLYQVNVPILVRLTYDK